MTDYNINIELQNPVQDVTQDTKVEEKQIRNRFIIQLFSTTAVVGFCIYSIISNGKLPEKDNIIYCLLGGASALWIPAPKILK